MRSRTPLVVPLLTVGLAVLATRPAGAAEPDFLAFALGGHDVNDNETAFEARLEYRSDIELLRLRPFSGVMVSSDQAVYAYGGVLLDLFFGNRAVLTPSFAVGYYDRGNGKDLGADIEFRSQIEAGYRFADRSRLALSFSHISSAGIDEVNPGTDELVVTYAVPFSVILGR